MRIASVGHVAFAATLIALGISGLIRGDVIAVWELPQRVPAREALAYLCAVISVATGVGLLWRRTATLAARVLLASLLLYLLAFKAPELLRAPTDAVSWESCAETVVIVAGAWVLYAWFATDRDRHRVGFATGEQGVRTARVLYGLAMIAFGVAHFAYMKYTASLVPAWLPWPVGWVCVTGAAYIAAGVAMLTDAYARLAAALSAWQMGMFTLLVWLPVLAAGSRDASQWSEGMVSWALTAAGWVVADSYRGVPWFATGRRWHTV
jgi:uncharacterized membrane protein